MVQSRYAGGSRVPSPSNIPAETSGNPASLADTGNSSSGGHVSGGAGDGHASEDSVPAACARRSVSTDDQGLDHLIGSPRDRPDIFNSAEVV